ncbi:hypothetical protein C8R46DRAFT_547157 [Mycena filopes]|nr:hypothetical protein C8R46DRAFT_547157 [Mycena filopes]
MNPLNTPRHPHHFPNRPPAPFRCPDPRDRGACARFRLARKRHSPAVSSPPAAASGSAALWRELVLIRRDFNDLSAVLLKQSQVVTELLQLHAQPFVLSSLPVQVAPTPTVRDTSLAPQPRSGLVIDDDMAGNRASTVSVVHPETVPVAVSTPPHPSSISSPGVADSRQLSAVSAEPQTPTRRNKADEALPKLRGMFNRKR